MAPEKFAAPAPEGPPDREHFADLMERVARFEDRDAFAALFAFYAPRVKSYLLRLSAEDALAEELAQEVMITVWRKAALFDRAQASVSTWIFRIARNRRIDAARRIKARALDPDEPTLAPADLTAPDDAVSANEREARVREALKDLPEEQLSLLRAAFYEGLSHREIAEKTGVPLGTVKSRIRLAFQRMRGRLDGAV
ncbi:MAG: sigma-70 family RNA polymerase sigma factor [Hyphomonadaceae bacterium]